MKRHCYLSVLLVLAASCKIRPNADIRYEDIKDPKIYRLRLNPAVGSKYYYDISNESHVKMEIGDRKTDNLNRSNTAAWYVIGKDSTGNFRLTMTYDKIHMYSKNGEQESDLEATDNPNAVEPMARMLNILKSANIRATVSPTGEIKTLDGYKEIGDKILAGFNPSDNYARNIAQNRWQQLIGDGLVRKNMEQLFRFFPDSVVHIGDKWKLDAHEKGDFSLNVRNTFTLRSISDGIATLDTEGEISSDSASTRLMGYDVALNLKGRQEGEYKIMTATGMLLSYRMSATISGMVSLLGKDVPVSIATSADLHGRKM